MINIFSEEGVQQFIDRIEKLTSESKPLWGKMSVDQMLAHLNVAYEMVYEPEKHPRRKGLTRWLLKTFVKKLVVGEKPYPRNTRTAPSFIIADRRDFQKEKQRLIENLKRTLELGPAFFDGRESPSFGPLTVQEWNNLYSKHLDHHLQQFGV